MLASSVYLLSSFARALRAPGGETRFLPQTVFTPWTPDIDDAPAGAQAGSQK